MMMSTTITPATKEDRLPILEKDAQAENSNDERIKTLQQELIANKVKYEQELYWLRLEFKTCQCEKEALEDQVATLFRDLQQTCENSSMGSDESIDVAILQDLQSRNTKQAKVIHSMTNQLDQMKQSSDAVIATLKDELNDLSMDKSRLEASLMSEVDNFERKVKALETRNSKSVIGALKNDLSESQENVRKLETSLQEESEKLRTLQTENAVIRQHNEKLMGDMLLLRSSADSIDHLNFIKDDRIETMNALERVGTVWKNTDDSVQSLVETMEGLKDDLSHKPSSAGERLLSTLEAASLVHGQVKISLMLIETKLRNNLSIFARNHAPNIPSPDKSEMMEELKTIQTNAMAAIEAALEQFQTELGYIRSTNEERLALAKSLEDKQQELSNQVNSLLDAEQEEEKNDMHDSTSSPCLVSNHVMDTLHREVARVVESLSFKNQEISKLVASVQEHKLREDLMSKEIERLRALGLRGSGKGSDNSSGSSEDSSSCAEQVQTEEGKVEADKVDGGYMI